MGDGDANAKVVGFALLSTLRRRRAKVAAKKMSSSSSQEPKSRSGDLLASRPATALNDSIVSGFLLKWVRPEDPPQKRRGSYLSLPVDQLYRASKQKGS